MKPRTTIFLCLLFLLLGAAITVLAINIHHDKQLGRWFSDNGLRDEGRPLFIYDDEYKDLGESKPFPGIKRFSFKAKFIPSVKKTNGQFQLGYIVEFEVQPAAADILDKTNPPISNSDKNVQKEVWKLTPPDKIFYKMHLDFECFDENGFPVFASISAPNRIISGKTYKYQDLTMDQIPIDVANRITKVMPKIVLLEGLGVHEEEFKEFINKKMAEDKRD
jgi:hypothetical protein